MGMCRFFDNGRDLFEDHYTSKPPPPEAGRAQKEEKSAQGKKFLHQFILADGAGGGRWRTWRNSVQGNSPVSLR